MFQESSQTQINLGFFWALIFYHGNILEHKKSTRWTTRPKLALVTRAPGQAAPLGVVWQSRLRCHPSSSHTANLDLKMSIYRPPKAFSRGGGGETRNIETEVVPTKIGVGNAAGVAPVASPTSPTSPPLTPP
jgi:hypothetical protein